MKVTISVHDQSTQKSYRTRAFPTGQKPGCFAAPVTLGNDEIHWVQVQLTDDSARIMAGNKVRSPKFKLQPVYDSTVRLSNGVGSVEYDVARRFHISVWVESSRALPS